MPRYYDNIEKQIEIELYNLLILPLWNIATISEKQNSVEDDAVKIALLQGKINYQDGIFTGDFNAEIGKGLRRLGASYDYRMNAYKLEDFILPDVVLKAAQVGMQRRVERNNAFLNVLDILAGRIPKYDTNIDFLHSATKIENDFKSIMGVDVNPNIKTAASMNYKYDTDKRIKDWCSNEVVKLREKVSQNIGMRAEELEQHVRDLGVMSKHKARFLARQETSLMLVQYRKEQFGNLGYEKFVWSAVMDGATRTYHKFLNNKVFRYDNPPVMNLDTGEHGLPGQDFGCRCVDRPLSD